MFINKEIKLERKQTQEYSRVGSTYNGFAYKVSLAGQHIGSIKRIRVGDEYSTQSKWQWWASQNRKGNPMFAKWDNPCNAIKLRDIDKWLDRECQRVLKGDLEGKESANADSDSGGLGAPEALTTDYNAALIIERQNIGTKTNGFRVSVFVNGEHFESIGENDADGGADLARRAAAFFENRTAETIAAHIDNVRNLRIGRVYDSAAMPVSSGYGLHHFTPEVSERIARLAALKKCGVDALITAALDALESPEYGDPDVSERKHRTEWFAARQPVNNHADAISADQLDLHHRGSGWNGGLDRGGMYSMFVRYVMYVWRRLVISVSNSAGGGGCIHHRHNSSERASALRRSSRWNFFEKGSFEGAGAYPFNN